MADPLPDTMDNWSHLLDAPQLLALAAALGWASGIRLYAGVFLVGGAGLHGLGGPARRAAGAAAPRRAGGQRLHGAVEFFADKMPLVDSLWDTVHTVIRIPAGARWPPGPWAPTAPPWPGWPALLGGSLAATSTPPR
jgi:hypothetical protein